MPLRKLKCAKCGYSFEVYFSKETGDSLFKTVTDGEDVHGLEKYKYEEIELPKRCPKCKKKPNWQEN